MVRQTPQSKHKRTRPGYENKGRIQEDRIAWVRLYGGDYILYEHTADVEEGFDYVLYQPRQGAKPWAIGLTNLTEAELRAFKKLVDFAFEKALPVCQQRDKAAQDAFDQGDDSHARLYRQLPQYVVRTRPSPQHSEELRSGPEGIPPMAGAPAASDGGVRISSPTLAQPLPSDAQAENDGTPPDSPS